MGEVYVIVVSLIQSFPARMAQSANLKTGPMDTEPRPNHSDGPASGEHMQTTIYVIEKIPHARITAVP